MLKSRKLLCGLTLTACCVVAAGDLLAARGGGRGGSGIGGGGGNWGKWFQQNQGNQPNNDPQQKQKADAKSVQKKVDKLMSDGWANLRVGDTVAAVDAFEDALELKPDTSLAKIGIGLARAKEQKYPAAIAQFESAAKSKATERVANYNLIVTYTRINQKPRAVIALNKHLTAHPDPVDEMMENATLSLLGVMDDATKKTIGMLPVVQKTLEQQEKTLALKVHEGRERWGIAWVPLGSASKLRAANAQLLYPAELPYLMPDLSPLPMKQGDLSYNVLLPELAGEAGKLMLAQVDALKTNPAVATVKPATPLPATPAPATPNVTVAAATPQPGVNPAIGAAPGTPANPATPASPVAPQQAGGFAQVALPTTQPAVAVASVSRGAAFAVTPELMVTVERLVANAESIEIVDVDGAKCPAEVVATDPAVGLALLKVAGTKFKPMPLADVCKTGPAGVACFNRASVFSPELSVLRGDVLPAGAGKFALKMASHPRSAGCPVADEKGNVLGMMIATREDPIERLPVIPVDVLKKFLAGKATLAPAAAVDPNDCVAELTVTRKQ